MKVSVVHSIPASNSEALIAVCLRPTDITAISQQLDLQENQLTEAHATRGTKTLISLPHATIWAIGLGNAASLEHIRKAGHQFVSFANEYGYASAYIVSNFSETSQLTALAESIQLTNYQFLVYKSKQKVNSLQTVQVVSTHEEADKVIEKGVIIAEATCLARDFINEPVITLTAEEFAKRIAEKGETYGFGVEVLNKARIKSLKMGGLLAVNFGSPDPPTFSILEHRPDNPINSQPIVLVGKGVVYDTGGLSLKPTANSMDFMKADMSGAAAVVGALCGLAKLNVPCHVIGLIPATDNRPGQNAYVPGDVITMYDGSTVEVLNTDAEGRMILADALAYAKQYQPALVIDLATLTGAKVVAIGGAGLAMMSVADSATNDALKAAGDTVYERLVEFPLWEEYGEMLNSDIADQKNIGGREAGSITAGKFLQRFTDYPWIHLDIAGSAWLSKPDSYRGKNGTGVGVRLLLEFLSNYGK